MKLIYKIANAIRLAGKPLTLHQILEALEDENIEIITHSRDSIDVTLCNNKSQYFIKEHNSCPHCGHKVAYYSLTDKGKIALAQVLREQLPITRTECEELGIIIREA